MDARQLVAPERLEPRIAERGADGALRDRDVQRRDRLDRADTAAELFVLRQGHERTGTAAEIVVERVAGQFGAFAGEDGSNRFTGEGQEQFALRNVQHGDGSAPGFGRRRSVRAPVRE